MFNLFRKKNQATQPAGPEQPRDRIRGPKLYDYREIGADDLGDYSNAIRDIYERKYDGLLIREAMPPAVADEILAFMRNVPREKGSTMPVGWSFPTIFAQQVNDVFREGEEAGRAGMAEWFRQNEAIYANSAEYFGVDVIKWVEDWLGKFSGGLPVAPPPGYDGQGRYAGTTFRSYTGKGVGNISVHCGNYFQKAFSDFYTHLETMVDVYDQLSYFFCLDQSQVGGDLSLYDFEWEEGQTKVSPHENERVIMADGSQLEIANRDKMTIDPRKGDMILFAGGQIWHRVEAVMGSRARATLGGFLCYAKDGKSVIYWS